MLSSRLLATRSYCQCVQPGPRCGNPTDYLQRVMHYSMSQTLFDVMQSSMVTCFAKICVNQQSLGHTRSWSIVCFS